MTSHRTIEGRSIAEIEEKKSRFIAQIAHAESEEEALAFLEEVRRDNRMARHNVYAYILRACGTERVRYSDDGEPQKTAGMPTLEALRHAELSDVICVTTRYFGGTLLGTGGLVRAYTQAAQAAIEAARVVTVSRCVDVTVRVAYPLHDQLMRLAADCGAHVADTQYTEDVQATFRLLDGEQDAFVAKVDELRRGTGSVSVSDPLEAAL